MFSFVLCEGFLFYFHVSHFHFLSSVTSAWTYYMCVKCLCDVYMIFAFCLWYMYVYVYGICVWVGDRMLGWSLFECSHNYVIKTRLICYLTLQAPWALCTPEQVEPGADACWRRAVDTLQSQWASLKPLPLCEPLPATVHDVKTVTSFK